MKSTTKSGRATSKRRKRKPQLKKTLPFADRVVLKPGDVQLLYGISNPTRWRYERNGLLPKRDVHIGGKPIGWYRSTLDAAARGPRAR
jgi:predicted DNA-binding transcriptional regulator AlpA